MAVRAKAGIAPGAMLVAVNSYPLDGVGANLLKPAIIAAEKAGSAPIELLIKADDRYRLLAIDYRDGLRQPHLEKIGDQPTLLDAILDPKE